MRPAQNARRERGHYTATAVDVLPSGGNFGEIFLNAIMSKRQRELYEFGPFVLNPAERQLLRDERPVSLRPKAFDLLLLLAGRPHHLFEKDELMDALWPEEEVEEGNLKKTVSALRRALGEAGDSADYIETVPRYGYRFVADVKAVGGGDAEVVIETRTQASLVVDEEADDGCLTTDVDGSFVSAAVAEPLAETHAAAGLARRLWRRPGSRAVVSAAVVAIALSAAYLFYPARGEAIDSVAVLPLVNEGGDTETEYLSDGISESLINSLSQLPGLKVTARSSSFKYKGREVDPREAARALGVAAILTGQVSRRGGDLSISIELVDARDNTHVWGERYDRRESDLLQVQAELSREIAEALRLRLTAGERRQLSRRGTIDPQAYELLLKGRFHWNKGGIDNAKKAVEYYRQAIDADPAYALAYAEMSVDLGNIPGLDPKESRPKIEAAAYKALELDEGLAEAHYAMANIKSDAWDWAATEREMKRALELNPNFARGHYGYAVYLSLMGRHDQAIAESRRARELDPLSPIVNLLVGYQLLFARRYDEAIEVYKRTLELDQNFPLAHTHLGYAYAASGRYAEAVAAYQEGIRLGDDSSDTQLNLAAAYALAGERGKARAILRRLEQSEEYVPPVDLATLYVALGEREQAFAALERAYAQHAAGLMFLRVSPSFDPLRSDPRFQELLRRVGLPQ